MIKRKFIFGFAKFRRFLKRHFSDRFIILILSVLIGAMGAAAAIIIKNVLHLTNKMLTHTFSNTGISYLYLIFPIIGILLTVYYVRRYVKDNISHGVSIVLKALCKSDGKLRFHNIYSSMVSSTITVGLGGSVGLEAPMVLTGSAIGSNMARFFHCNSKQTRLLLACGSAAAMAAIFKAPIAGIVFTFEVLMLDLTSSAILPLLLSAATGTVLSLLFLGRGVMFSVAATTHPFRLINIPLYIILGLLTGLISVFFLRISTWIDRCIKKIKRPYLRAFIGGTLLCLLIYLFPVFYGEGYDSINMLLNGHYDQLLVGSPLWGLCSNRIIFFIAIAGIILLKVFATTFTTSAGGIGGVFAPTLFIGAFTGFFVAAIAHHITGANIPYVNFILAGMAGVMTGVMQAPLTAMFLIAELSTGYTLLIPLMITAACSYLIVNPFEKYSVYTRSLAEKGNLRTHNKDKYALRKLQWEKFIDTDIQTIPLHATLRTYTQTISKSKRNLFVVIDARNCFAGLLVMDSHRDIIFQTEVYDLVHVEDLMIEPEEFIYQNDTAAEVLEKFNRTGNFNMPVITQDRKYIGFLSKARFLAEYQNFVASESED